ncbi:chemotaxis protein [Deinococcus irradiatisoli]|uniref:Chemotaxis protein n=1 Tax=Deinococcus irradiatisoli TaxID=2202254 RepID=A0A2Z3JKK1_9DEIO|nr:CheR family methyltransferase [Deinococcus irradiatisoli]AWN23830.1 chemotaxis protein [Deinococcus irradiatisoli]
MSTADPSDSSGEPSGAQGPAPTPPDAPPVAVVGLGGSAGSLDAFERFFVGLPLGSELAFVVVSHLDPHQESLMPEILQRCTVLPVLLIQDDMALKADHIYVTPPGFSVGVQGGRLRLEALERAQGHIIDAFFSSLARDRGEQAVGVILSGMGQDGTAGLQAIKAAGGQVLVQDPQSAEFSSMPEAAIKTGLADVVLPAEDIAPRLYELVTHTALLAPGDLEAEGQTELQKILLLVRSRTGQDFTGYKVSTLVRRIDRRMKSQRIPALGRYLRFLIETPGEVEALAQDLTINVTRFFRDPDAFARLKEHLRSTLMIREPDQVAVRVWVAGCSTGEEAYSVAIVLHELMEELGRPLSVQVFATDIDPQAIATARLGLYPHSIAQIVSAQRLGRYFKPSEEGYQIQGFIRESVVFAQHNTFSDPPFTRLDLLCCRNLLIYLKTELQRHILAVFHYALKPGGLLFLGTSETLGPEREHFSTLDSHWRIYRRGQEAARPLPSGQIVARGESSLLRRTALPFQPDLRPQQRTLSQQAQRVLLTQYAPPAVVINLQGEILFVSGQTGRYLELPSGTPSPNNVLEMVQDNLRYDLAAAINTLKREPRELKVRSHLTGPSGSVLLEITLRPLHGPEQGLLLLIFHEQPASDAPRQDAPSEPYDMVQALRQELHHTRETLQATVEEAFISVEELKSTNEEYQTTIEELKSTNEELMTSKEELQSLNEELITTNSEHQRIISELGQANDDMNNLLESAGIATLFLGNDFKIKRFTPRFANVIRLLPGDIGRPIGDFHLKLRYPHFQRDVAQVLSTLLPFETQVQTDDGHWFLMRITPYRTASNFIDGVVVAFTNLDSVKVLEEQASISARYAQALLERMPDAVMVFNGQKQLLAANPAFYRLLRTTPARSQGHSIDQLGLDQLALKEVQNALNQLLADGQPIRELLLDVDMPGLGRQPFKLEAWPAGAAEDGSGSGSGENVYLLLLENLSTIAARLGTDSGR